jgi:hypothetical protein
LDAKYVSLQDACALPPGLPIPESKPLTAESLAEVASYMSKKDAQALSAQLVKFPPPGLASPNGGTKARSMSEVASHMSSKDAEALSAAIGAPPGLPSPSETGRHGAATWPLKAHMAVATTPQSASAKAKTTGMSLEELIEQSSEKYDLDMKFWRKYKDVQAMTLAKQKEDILEIIENFAAIHRKHGHLFQKLKATVFRTIDDWSAPELAALCHAWAKLGFKHEDLCVTMADRVCATIHECNPRQIGWIWDAYASARVTIPSVTEAVTVATYKRIDDFTLEEICNHASAYARLNLPIAPLFTKIGDKLVEGIHAELKSDELGTSLNARGLSLAAYSFAKLGFYRRDVFDAVAAGAVPVARNFTAKDLQMIMVAFAKAPLYNSELVQALSAQASRRLAQFSAESLALTLRSLAAFQHKDDALLARVVDQLPRLSPTFRPIDMVTTLNAFAALEFYSPSLFDILTPTIVQQAPVFNQSDWVGALEGYSWPGRRDERFLNALSNNLKSKRSTIQQLAATMSGCASLSFNRITPRLAEAASIKVSREGVQLPADTAAQMYSALALLGCNGAASPKVDRFLNELSSRLAVDNAVNELDVRSCLDLCYASLIAKPKEGAEHPIQLSDLLERLESQAASFSQEEQLLLGQMQEALKLLPWNPDEEVLFPLRLEEFADEVDSTSGHADVPLAFFSSVVGVLAPHSGLISSWMHEFGFKDGHDRRNCAKVPSQARLGGVHAAAEVRDGLEDVSATLQMHDVEHSIVTDNLLTGAYLQTNLGSGAIRFVWGSSVHYVDDLDDPDGGRQHLVPAARFQVAAVKAETDATVIVVPHWRWRQNDDKESKARCLYCLVHEHLNSPVDRSVKSRLRV